jgi:hypothetical protein
MLLIIIFSVLIKKMLKPYFLDDPKMEQADKYQEFVYGCQMRLNNPKSDKLAQVACSMRVLSVMIS